jgi:4-amino-4-deoxy-L-arabinose transferase-like glycosyltransferase
MQANSDRLVAIGCFGIACAIGLVGAFVGLDVSSFWLDELYTAWITENGISFKELIARVVTDLHPPVYHVIAFAYAHFFGDDEIGLRSLSALCGVAAIILFVVGAKPYFSLAARLFAGAIATSSFFWFYQVHNARGYALSFLIGVGILLLALSILAKRKQRDARLTTSLAAMAVLMLIGSFVHFYLMYMCLAVLIMLGLLCPRPRILLMTLAAALLASTATYVKFVVEVFSQYSTTSNWIHGDVHWYLDQFNTVVNFTFTKKAMLALAICAGVLLFQRLKARSQRAPFLAFGRFPLDAQTALFVGVPVIVLAGGITSSLLISPNFTDRNLLISSPFIWAFCAKLYDAAVPDADRPIRTAANLMLSAVVLWMAVAMVMGRTKQWHEPFRQSADWIRSFPECRDRPILVINAQPRSWFKPGYAEVLYADFYGSYLGDFATPQVLFLEDILAHKIPEDVKEYLRWRIDGNGCPIIAWSIHLISAAEIEAASRELMNAIGRPAGDKLVQTKMLHDGVEGYVLYVERPKDGTQPGALRDPGPPPSQRKTSPAPTPGSRIVPVPPVANPQ